MGKDCRISKSSRPPAADLPLRGPLRTYFDYCPETRRPVDAARSCAHFVRRLDRLRHDAWRRSRGTRIARARLTRAGSRHLWHVVRGRVRRTVRCATGGALCRGRVQRMSAAQTLVSLAQAASLRTGGRAVQLLRSTAVHQSSRAAAAWAIFPSAGPSGVRSAWRRRLWTRRRLWHLRGRWSAQRLGTMPLSASSRSKRLVWRPFCPPAHDLQRSAKIAGKTRVKLGQV